MFLNATQGNSTFDADKLHNPMSAEEHETITAEVFNEWSQGDRAVKMAAEHNELLNPLFENWHFDEQSSLLDVGCGVGAALSRAHKAGAEQLAGLDLAQGMIDKAKENLPSQADLQVGSVLSLPWEGSTFSHVLSVEALYYIDEPRDAIREIYRVLKSGGTFSMIIEFYWENKGTHIWADNLPMKITNWSEQQWCAAFREAGFSDVTSNRVIRKSTTNVDAFKPSKYWPSYEQYTDYIKEGALWVSGYKGN